MKRIRIAGAMCFILTAAVVAAADEANTPARAIPVYTEANAPPTPRLEDLALVASVSQYGVTWTFEKPARVGRFVNGDYYVVGPTTVTKIDPAPANGRNGSMLNIAIDPKQNESKIGFDDRTRSGRYDRGLFQAPPFPMKPGDALVSSISFEKVEALPRRMLPRSPTDKGQARPIRAASVLTCVAEPLPSDAFRPAYCDRKQTTIHLARNLRRDRLPTLKSAQLVPKLAEMERIYERLWLDVCMDEFGAPDENMPIYGNEFTRAIGLATLLLATDLKPAEKETLLIGVCQVGIDTFGLLEAGKPGWRAHGGHGNGRKWTVLFTGLMLDDDKMKHPNRSFPNALFSEDLQTMFDDCWTGAKVVYGGHVGPQGDRARPGWGRYEHLHPSKWESDVGENYRRCCTSMAWIGEALAIQLYKAESLWAHEAFLVYADRWMYEDDTEFVKVLKQTVRSDYDYACEWSRQGKVWDPFVKSMWDAYRPTLAAPTNRWQLPQGGAGTQPARGE